MSSPADYTGEIGDLLARLQRIRDRTYAHLTAHASSRDVDPAAYGCLFRLLADGPMRSGELAEAMFTDPSTTSRQVAQLVERGLVRREADPTDGRASVLVVTDAGRETTRRLREVRNSKLERVLTDWSVDDRRDFATLMHRFLGDYERRRPELAVLGIEEETRR